MGGDHAPETPVAAAMEALEKEESFEIVLIGDEARVRPLLASRRHSGQRLEFVHAPEVIEMDDAPTRAMRHKRRSSVVAGLELQREGQADAFISAGNTGAVMAAALLTLGRIEGIARPAIMATFPTQKLPCVVLDVGANAECRPRHLVEFAVMGHSYAIDVLGRSEPRVGLLSIGEEAGKGNDLTIETHARLSSSALNFIGNVEGRDVLSGSLPRTSARRRC